jgi:hypothetical protein
VFCRCAASRVDPLVTEQFLYSTASGDIRNLVTTVNSLPSDYSGKCTCVLNDIQPVVSWRNIITLHALASKEIPLEQAVEMAIQISYSALVTEPTMQYLQRIATLFRTTTAGSDDPFTSAWFHTRGKGDVTFNTPTAGLKSVSDMISSTYDAETAHRNMKFIRMNPSRIDYLDRYLFTLKPPHRLAACRYRDNGILLPFGMSTDRYTQPNRHVFS